MNRKFKALVGIAMCALTFAACKKDHLPSSEETMAAKANGNAGLIQPAPTYTLVRRGTDSLEYYNDGRLAKVIHQFGYTVYNYGGFNSIVAKTYGNGNLLEQQDTYQIDVNTGRVYEQESKGFTNSPNGAIVTTNVYKFTYDAKGRPVQKYNKADPDERLEFTYYANDNLYMIKKYNSNGFIYLVHKYDYDLTAPANKLKLNPEKQGIDKFLPIFGKFTKQLPTLQTSSYPFASTFLTSESLIYTVNNDGHVTKFDRLDNLKNGNLAETVAFRYKSVRQN